MALASGTQWELRTTGTASNVNGGGFNPANTGNGGGPGTDYSQQDSSQYTFTDLASTSASSFLVITSVSHSFIGSDCGNLIHINTTGTGAHFTVGWYEIVSVSAGAATVDRACGTTSDASGGTYHVGGALSDGTAAPLITGGVVAGNTVWVKAATYSIGSSNWNWSGAVVGTTSLECFVIGYNATHGDNPTGANRPQINFTSGVFLTGSYVTWVNMSFKGASPTSGQGVAFWSGGLGQAYNCKFVDTYTGATNVGSVGVTQNCNFFDCEFVSYFGAGVFLSTNGSIAFFNCWFHDSPYGLIQSTVGATNLILSGCTFSGCYTACFQAASGSTLNTGHAINNTFYGGESTKIGIGINMLGSTNQKMNVQNNIFYGFTTGFVSGNVTGANYENYNDYFNNTADVSGITKGPNDIALNPTFTSIGQYTGATATSSGSVLTDSGAAFTNIVGGRDYLYVSAMTGGNGPGIYGIVSTNNTTTVTTDNALGTGSGITYSIIYGQNWAVGSNMQAVGNGHNGNLNQTSYIDIGAVQRKERASTDPGIANVKTGTNYTINDTALTGTLVSGGTSTGGTAGLGPRIGQMG